jgi:hypothetical protein
MIITPNSHEIKRSFPEAREFLSTNILGADYPVKHLIEQARNKGQITRGKRGRGGGVVTSRDMAMLLVGTLAGDTPQVATDAMGKLASMTPDGEIGKYLELNVAKMSDGWWNQCFVDVVGTLIQAWRADQNFDFLDMDIRVLRGPVLSARIIWNPPPYDRDVVIPYWIDNLVDDPAVEPPNLRRLTANYSGNALKMVADWLEGREVHE